MSNVKFRWIMVGFYGDVMYLSTYMCTWTTEFYRRENIKLFLILFSPVWWMIFHPNLSRNCLLDFLQPQIKSFNFSIEPKYWKIPSKKTLWILMEYPSKIIIEFNISPELFVQKSPYLRRKRCIVSRNNIFFLLVIKHTLVTLHYY